MNNRKFQSFQQRPVFSSGRQPATAAMLSVIPGLGQFYNGQSVKGFLFMDVAVVNAVLFMIVLFAEPMSNGLRSMLMGNHVKPNDGVLQALSSAHLGTPFSAVLITSILLFVGFAVRDAYEGARGQKLKPIYGDSALQLSEAASGSYLFHFVAMFSCALFALCFLVPKPERQQVVEIDFYQTPMKDVEPLKAKKFSDVSSSARHREIQVKNPSPPTSSASQARSQSAHQNQPTKSVAKPDTPAKSVAPKQAVSKAEPAPAPPKVNPLPMARQAAPSHNANPLPMPLSAPKMVAPTPLANSTPVPSISKAAAAAPALPSPLLAMAPALTAGPGPAPLAISHAASASHGGPAPAEARRSSAASSLPGGPPAPVGVLPGSDSNSNTPAPISGDHSRGQSSLPRGESLTPRKIASALPPGGALASHPVGTPSVPRVDSKGNNTESDIGRAPVSTHANPDFGPYMAELQRRIKRNWEPPKGPETRQVVVEFTVFKSGELGSVRLSRSSGMALNDQAAIAAIRKAAPFAPLPKYSEDSVDIQFTFDYRVFGGHANF